MRSGNYLDYYPSLSQLKPMLADERSSTATEQALPLPPPTVRYATSPGTTLAVQALTGVMDEVTVSTVVTAYTRDLIRRIWRWAYHTANHHGVLRAPPGGGADQKRWAPVRRWVPALSAEHAEGGVRGGGGAEAVQRGHHEAGHLAAGVVQGGDQVGFGGGGTGAQARQRRGGIDPYLVADAPAADLGSSQPGRSS